jgi:hypothetical protein
MIGYIVYIFFINLLFRYKNTFGLSSNRPYTRKETPTFIELGRHSPGH